MRIRDDVDWLPLVRDTEKWMREERRAIHDDTVPGGHRSHITREDWSNKFRATYGVAEEDWLCCLTKMYSAGYIIGCDPGRGFYLADPMNGPTSVTRLVNYVTTLCHTVDKILESMAEGGHWDEMLPGFKGRVRIGDLDNIATLLEGAQIQLSDQVRTVLLEAKSRFEENEDIDDSPSSGVKLG